MRFLSYIGLVITPLVPMHLLKAFYLTLIGCLYFQVGYAQDQFNKDSLDQLIAQEPIDSIKLKHIIAAIESLEFSAINELEEYFNRGIKSSDQKVTTSSQMELYLQTGKRAFNLGEYHYAKLKYDKLEQLAIRAESLKYQANANLYNSILLNQEKKPKIALELLRETLDLLTGTNEYTLTATILTKMSNIERVLGNPKVALSLLRQSEEFFKKSEDLPNYLESLNVKGRIYRSLGEYDSARTTYSKVVDLAIEGEQDASLSRGYNNLGNIDQLTGNIEGALGYYMKSLEIKERMGNKKGIALALHNIAGIKFNLNLYKESIEYYKKSKTLSEEIKYTRITQLNELKIGNSFNELDHLDSALIYHNRALNIAKESQDQNGIALCYINLSEDYSKLNDFNKALDYLKDALNISYSTKNLSYQGAALSYIATAYLNAKEFASKNPDAAQIDITLNNNEIENYLLEAKRIADDLNNFENKETSLEGLNYLYTETNNYKANTLILKEHLSLKDSIFTKERTKAIADWETKYETAEKEKEIVLLEAAKKASSARIRFWSAISILLLAILGIGSYLYAQLQKTRKKLVLQNDELTELNQVKDKFFGIIAHDIRSPIVALENVDEQMNYYLKKENTEKLSKLGVRVGNTAKHLNSLLDNLLNWALVQTKGIPYHPEQLDVAEAWHETTQLLKANADTKGIQFRSAISPELTVFADSPSFNTILRNLTSNALKYSNADSTILFSAMRENGQTSFKVKDEGIGMSLEKVKSLFTLEKKSQKGTAGERGTGLGLILCKDLVELNKGTISVESVEGKGSIFGFSIPEV